MNSTQRYLVFYGKVSNHFIGALTAKFLVKRDSTGFVRKALDLEDVVAVTLKLGHSFIELLHFILGELGLIHPEIETLSGNVLIVIQVADDLG
jgi:hypothetical protein